MILTDREIKIAIENDAIKLDPKPNELAFSSTSVDLTLDGELTEFNQATAGIQQALDPASDGFKFEDIVKAIATKRLIDADSGFPLPRGKLILGWTQELVDLKSKSRIAARVEGKSSLARMGLGVHITAPTIHAGFRGRVRLEIVNHGPLPIILRTGMRICQLIFEQTLGTPDRGYSGQFLGQKT